MIKEKLNERQLMPVWDCESVLWPERKKEILHLLCEEEYGFFTS